MKRSSGTLLYRDNAGQLEVLIVHPSGNYNRGKPWSIPKGMPDEGEESEAAARRETLEETGIVAGPLVPLGEVRYRKSGKVITAFGGRAPKDAVPACASWEIDQAEFVPLERARLLLHPDQVLFLDRLLEQLAQAGP